MEEKIKNLFVDLADILTELKRLLSSPTLDKKAYKSKISSKVVQLRMHKSEIPGHANADDFIKQCERVSLTLGAADVDRALLQWRALDNVLHISFQTQTKSKSGLELICEKYRIFFENEAKDEKEQKDRENKELKRIKEKYKI